MLPRNPDIVSKQVNARRPESRLRREQLAARRFHVRDSLHLPELATLAASSVV